DPWCRRSAKAARRSDGRAYQRRSKEAETAELTMLFLSQGTSLVRFAAAASTRHRLFSDDGDPAVDCLAASSDGAQYQRANARPRFPDPGSPGAISSWEWKSVG